MPNEAFPEEKRFGNHNKVANIHTLKQEYDQNSPRKYEFSIRSMFESTSIICVGSLSRPQAPKLSVLRVHPTLPATSSDRSGLFYIVELRWDLPKPRK